MKNNQRIRLFSAKEEFSILRIQAQGEAAYPLYISVCSSRSIYGCMRIKLEKKRLHISIELTVPLPRLRSVASIYVAFSVLNYQDCWPLAVAAIPSRNISHFSPIQNFQSLCKKKKTGEKFAMANIDIFSSDREMITKYSYRLICVIKPGAVFLPPLSLVVLTQKANRK